MTLLPIIEPDHPLGLTEDRFNPRPEWETARKVRQGLYLESRREQREAEREPFPSGAIAVGGCLCIAICLLSYLTGVLIG